MIHQIRQTFPLYGIGFDFKLEVYLEGLLKPFNSDKDLIAEGYKLSRRRLKANRKVFWVSI